jgi:hypothetical protein
MQTKNHVDRALNWLTVGGTLAVCSVWMPFSTGMPVRGLAVGLVTRGLLLLRSSQ